MPPVTLETDCFIDRALPDLAGWLECFDVAHLPVLRSTALAVEELRANEDNIDAHLLADSFSHDPLMILKLLAHVADVRRGREGTDTETVTAALVMLGIAPFFRHFGRQPTVEDLLEGNEVARSGFEQALTRARRAARFAVAFAVQRMDHDVAVIHQAALLHDFTELLMWVKKPALAAQVRSGLSAAPAQRSTTVQAAVLNAWLDDLQQALMRKWRLPELLVAIAAGRPKAASSAQARNVELAVRLARHTTDGWDTAVIASNVQDIATLLNMAVEPTLALLRDLDDAP